MRILPTPASVKLLGGETQLPTPLTLSGPPWLGVLAASLATSSLLPRFSYGSGGVQVSCRAELSPIDNHPNSSYTLRVESAGVRILAHHPAGVVQALRTIGQLPDPAPNCIISDAPRYSHRGVMLDVCRHFMPVSFVRQLLEVMAALGLNVFHWHLTEDQGWRIPIERFPRLTEVGATRIEADGSSHTGHYTREEIDSVLSYADSLGILVMPEIELPGHSQAAIAAYPHLSCRGSAVEVRTKWGISEEVLCPGKESTFEFLEAVLREVISIFPSQLIHIGGDECPKTRWRECPHCRKRIREEGLSEPGNGTAEEALQSYTVGRIAEFLARNGRRAMGWDEILEGGLPEGTTVMSWRGVKGGIAAARLGHEVVMTPTSHCYFDYRQSTDPDEPGFPYTDPEGNPSVTTFADVAGFDPRSGLSRDEAAHVLGGQANLWTELVAGPQQAQERLMPRLIALSQALWHGPSGSGAIGELETAAREWLPRLEEIDWRVYPTPRIYTP